MTFEEWWKKYPTPGGEDYVAAKAAWNARSEAVQRVPPLDITKIPEGFRGVVWFRADGIYTMGDHGWERYSPSETPHSTRLHE